MDEKPISQTRLRLIEYLKFKKISQKQFETSIGVANGFVNSIKKAFNYKTSQKIKAQYPDLNIDWLVTGKGEMLCNTFVDGHTPLSIKDRIKMYATTKKLNLHKFEESINVRRGFVNSCRTKVTEDVIKKILSIYNDLNSDWLRFGKGTMMCDSINFNPTEQPTEQPTIKKPTSISDMDVAALKERIWELEAINKKMHTLIMQALLAKTDQDRINIITSLRQL